MSGVAEGLDTIGPLLGFPGRVRQIKEAERPGQGCRGDSRRHAPASRLAGCGTMVA